MEFAPAKVSITQLVIAAERASLKRASVAAT